MCSTCCCCQWWRWECHQAGGESNRNTDNSPLLTSVHFFNSKAEREYALHHYQPLWASPQVCWPRHGMALSYLRVYDEKHSIVAKSICVCHTVSVTLEATLKHLLHFGTASPLENSFMWFSCGFFPLDLRFQTSLDTMPWATFSLRNLSLFFSAFRSTGCGEKFMRGTVWLQIQSVRTVNVGGCQEIFYFSTFHCHHQQMCTVWQFGVLSCILFRLRQAEWKENPEANYYRSVASCWAIFSGHPCAAGNDGKVWLDTGHGAMIPSSFSTAFADAQKMPGEAMQGKVAEKEPEALEAELLGFLSLKLQVKYGETNRIWCKPRINVIF